MADTQPAPLSEEELAVYKVAKQSANVILQAIGAKP